MPEGVHNRSLTLIQREQRKWRKTHAIPINFCKICKKETTNNKKFCSVECLNEWMSTSLEYKEIMLKAHNTPEFIANHSGPNNSMNRPGVKEKHAEVCASDAHRDKLSIIAIERWQDPKVHEKHSISQIERWKDNLQREKQSIKLIEYSKTPGAHEKYSTVQIKRYEDPSEHEKLSIAAIEHWSNPAMFLPDHDETAHFRSKQEATFARMLNALDIEWYHEPKTFKIPSQSHNGYLPDFYLPTYNLWVELKNQSKNKPLCVDDQKKIAEFHMIYPNEHLIIMYKEDTKRLEHDLVCCEPLDIRSFGTPLRL